MRRDEKKKDADPHPWINEFHKEKYERLEKAYAKIELGDLYESKGLISDGFVEEKRSHMALIIEKRHDEDARLHYIKLLVNKVTFWIELGGFLIRYEKIETNSNDAHEQ